MNKILFIRSSTNPGPRVVRMMRFFRARNYTIDYWSPVRGSDKVLNELEFNRWALAQYPYFSGDNIFTYLKFLVLENFRILIRLLRYYKNFKLVHISDLELAFFAVPICKLLKIPIIYNIHDNFSERYGTNFVITRVLSFVESLYVKMANVALVPAPFRRCSLHAFCREKVLVIDNFADDLEINVDVVNFNASSQLQVIYAGWISPTRGLLDCLNILKGMRESGWNIVLKLYGWGDESEISQICSTGLAFDLECKYLGQVRQSEVLSSLEEAHLSFAFYDVSKPININTASNKIPEILASDTILVTTKGTKIEESLSENSSCLSFDGDIEQVVKKLNTLLSDEHALKNHLRRQKDYFLENYDNERRTNKLEYIYKKITNAL